MELVAQYILTRPIVRCTSVETARRRKLNEPLRDRLLTMAEEDQRVRSELAETGDLFEGYAPRMEEVLQRNASELKSIITEFGWPGKSLVGEDGARAAWLVLQHAIGNPPLLRGSLPILQEAARKGEIEPAHPAYLEDRICFFERRPQRYGTQLDWNEAGVLVPWLIEEPEKVDELRASVGLVPLSERLAEARNGVGEASPSELKERRAQSDAWSKLVGWT